MLAARDEGFIQITQATGKIKQDLAFVEQLAAVSGRPVIHNAIAPTRRDPDPHRKSLDWLRACWDQGLQVYGQCATVRSGFVFTLEDWNLYDFSKPWRGHDHRHARREAGEDGRPGAARGAWWPTRSATRTAYRKLRPGVGGSIENLVVQGVAGRAGSRTYVGRSLADIGTGARASTPAR